MQAELKHDIRTVCLNGPDGNFQLHSDLLIRFPRCQEANNFNLARSCPGTCPLAMPKLTSRLEKSFQHDFGYFGGEETPPLRNDFDGFYDGFRSIGFQYVSASSCMQCALHHLAGLVTRKHNKLGIRNCPSDSAYYLDSIDSTEFGHADIGQDDIRFQF